MFEEFSPWHGKKRSKKDRDARRSGRASRKPASRSRRPRFELLELRALLSGMTFAPLPLVPDSNNTADNNLRSAITLSNADATADTDTINLSAGTYSLSLGQLSVTNTTVGHSLMIVGEGSTGANPTIITTTTLDRILSISSGATVTLENLEITGGTAETDSAGGTTEADGGGINNVGTLTLTNVAIVGNTAKATVVGEIARGGGIFSTGSLTITGTTLVNNLIQNNSALAAAGNSSIGGGEADGGGIYSNSTVNVSISQTTISGNTAQGGAGFDGSTSTAAGGPAGVGVGGGVFAIDGTGSETASFTNDAFTGNKAIGGLGGNGATGLDSGAGGDAFAGGAAILQGAIGVFNAVTLSGNIAQGGSAGTAGTGGTAGANGSGFGGAIETQANTSGSALLNVTIYGNQALGGNSSTLGFGGGVLDKSVELLIAASTFSANIASGTGGGLDNISDGSLKVQNTLIAGNTAPTSPDVVGAVASSDDNLIGDDTGSTGFSVANGDQLGTSGSPINPKLGALGNNGGSLQTVALLAGSPAFGAGDTAVDTANSLTTDERGTGFARVSTTTHTDVGALQTQLIEPAITSTSTPINTQSTSGLVITPAAADATVVSDFEIASITGGSLFESDGTTPILAGSFITVAQGAAGLKFTPTSGDAGFTTAESTTDTLAGVGGTTVAADITVTGHAPSITTASTTELTQTTSGLVITPNAQDGTIPFFQITGITGGSLFQNDGTTPINNGDFITTAEAGAGLKFTPSVNFTGSGSFQAQEATANNTSSLLTGATATADIAVTFAGATVTGASTPQATQTTSGLVITPGTLDTPSDYQITGITGGTLFQHDGTTQINNGDFITTAQGSAGLKFTPNSASNGTFTIQESSSASGAGLSGPTTLATITITFSPATVTAATTPENTQTTAGLVITPGTLSATFLQINTITGGTLFQNNGTTQINSGDFITAAQGAAGLKFTPTTGSLTAGSFSISQATGSSVSDIIGPAAAATITVTLGTPTVTSASTFENTQTTSGLVITPGAPGTTNFQITVITGGTLFQNDGTTQINSGDFITLAQGAAGLKFTPTTGSLAGGSFTVQQATGTTVGSLSGSTAAATITIASTQAVDLSSAFNVTGITTDGAHFGGGLDGVGNALSETQVGSSLTWNGITFGIGPADAFDVIAATGQTISLPAGNFSTLNFLATGTNGNQSNQTFIVKYTDGTSTTFSEGISDWFAPQGYPGESVALASPYRNTAQGGRDNRTFDVYGYSLPLNTSKTVASVTLPINTHDKILSMVLVTPTAAPTSLAATAPSSTEVDLTWTAPAGTTVTGYNVYRGTTSGGESLTPVNSTPLAASATSFHDTTVSGGNTYFYVVKAISGSGVSAASTEASATTPTVPPDAPTSEIDLSGLYNQVGITTDGAQFSGSGLDGTGHTLSANQLGTTQTIGAVTFNIAPAGTNNVISSDGQTIGLLHTQVSQVQVLALAVNGNQFNQTFTVNFTNGTSQTFTQNVSDWFSPQAFANQSTAVATPYRNTSSGGRDNRTFNVYEYTLNITNSSQTVASISLPNDSNVKVLAISTVAASAAPTALTATVVSTTEADLSWTAPSSVTVTGYNVYRGTIAGGESATPLNSTPLAASATSFKDTTGLAGNTYFYVVQAIIGQTVGGASNEASATLTTSGTTSAVDLTGLFNQQGITADGAHFSAGIDGMGDALSATQLGTSQTVASTTFDIAPAGANNVIVTTGQTIGLPNGKYSDVEFLALGVNGNQLSQPFVVHYTDGTSASISQSLSDWGASQGFSNESAVALPYRNTAGGGRDNRTFNVYAYTLAIDNTKTISSITLPGNYNVKLLSITLVK
jgi:hypothetical protein